MNIIKRKVVEHFVSKKGDTLKRYKKLESFQRGNFNEVQELVETRLKTLLNHSYSNVPYYRDLFKEAGLVNHTDEIELKRFTEIPVLTKKILKTQYDNLVSEDINKRKFFVNTSGGSTGEPVSFIQDEEYAEWREAVKILDDTWSFRLFNEKQVRLWGSEKDLLHGKETIKTRISRYLKNEVWLNAFQMSPDDMKDYVNKINKFKPVQILAYVESVFELAKFIEKNKLKVHSPRSIMTTAGTLHPEMRMKIEEVFQTEIFNRYGSREVGDIACECKQHKGLHVSSPTHYVEIINNKGEPVKPGEIGEILVTSLTNYAMPLIRYKIGDLGVWSDGKCKCGCNYPVLEEITGRSSDIFIANNGNRIRGGYFTKILYDFKWINKFQVVQEEYNLINLFIISDNITGDIQADIKGITDKFKEVMGRDCKIEVSFVDEISFTNSGKYRYTISKVT
ncbi:phenylacetate--CoA ligase family protein [Shouchella shacheensis]|uniref:phenylacetate--CoA ligase family protein n=1 Tax=Shouchella shacheensis TaxID=1649580 RepID=UPI000740116A|nr:phenylacetate--CoA ligase family protein [Shouchella shacheensis]